MEQKSINILIVDDHEDSRDILGKVLKFKGYNVEGVGSGLEAISKLKQKFFNLVFLDIRLPDKSGLDVLKSIKEISEDTIVIMATASVPKEISVQAMEAGAYSYITKPLNLDQVLKVTKEALEKQRSEVEMKQSSREPKED